MQPQKNAVVIGAGFGGLAAALRLTARGHRTTVIDALAGPGGRGVQFVRKTAGQCFRYDAGPTVLTAPVLFEELFALFGERLADHVDLLPVAPWYRMRFADGSVGVRFRVGSEPHVWGIQTCLREGATSLEVIFSEPVRPATDSRIEAAITALDGEVECWPSSSEDRLPTYRMSLVCPAVFGRLQTRVRFQGGIDSARGVRLEHATERLGADGTADYVFAPSDETGGSSACGTYLPWRERASLAPSTP